MHRLCKVFSGSFSVLFALTCSALAHDPGLSSANVDLQPGGARVVLTFNERDLALVAGIAPETLAPHAQIPRPVLALLTRAVSLEAEAQILHARSSDAQVDANHNVALEFDYDVATPASSIVFRSLLLNELPFGHRQAFLVRDTSGNEVARAILSANSDAARFAFSATQNPSPPSASFLEFLRLGIGHILTGYDHLLFLFGLLIMCRTVRSAALLITCFTIAHSLTLALSTFGLVNLPSRFVEATIAASILYVGVENLLRPEPKIRSRALLTFAFGLIHGLGFASVLREMGIAKTGMAAVIPLVAFNGGVEIGQLGVAAVILPVIWLLRRRETFRRRGVPICSLAVALAGGYWLFERTIH